MKKLAVSALLLASSLAWSQEVGRTPMCEFAADVVGLTVAARAQDIAVPAATAMVQHRMGGTDRRDRSIAIGVELAYERVPVALSPRQARERLLRHCVSGLPGGVPW